MKEARRRFPAAEVSLAAAGAVMIVAAFLPWTRSPSGNVTGWRLTSRFGAVWDFASDGWIDSGWTMTTGIVSLLAGGAVLLVSIASLVGHRRESRSVLCWVLGIAALVAGTNPAVGLRRGASPAEPALVGIWLSAFAAAAVPTLLAIDLIALSVTARGAQRSAVPAARWMGIVLLAIAGAMTLWALASLGEGQAAEYRFEKAATIATLGALPALVGTVLVLRNRHRRSR